jgi:hypothetical protein
MKTIEKIISEKFTHNASIPISFIILGLPLFYMIAILAGDNSGDPSLFAIAMAAILAGVLMLIVLLTALQATIFLALQIVKIVTRIIRSAKGGQA